MIPGDKLYHIGNTRFLVYDGDQNGVPYGHVEDTVTGESTPPQPAEQLLARGYWEDYIPGAEMIDMPPPLPPAAVQQAVQAADPFADWQPGMTSPWDPEGFPQESFVDNISDVDRAAYLFNAGFTGDDLITMVAISMGENQAGDPWARGPYSKSDNTGENEGKWHRALGLQQIRPLTSPQDHAGDEWRDYAQLLDPQYNADAAWTEFKQKKGFRGWEVYNKDIYLRFMDRAREAVEGLNQILGREE
jgi:hypothetical protein